jgi:2,4-didehydro-3-deoxy-L-rhamnonate hydrolase
MRMVTIDGRAGLLASGAVFDIEELSSGRIPSDPLAILSEHWEQLRSLAATGASAGGVALDETRLGSPVPRPPTIFGIGLNYHSHAEETGREVTSPPAIFAKFPSAVTGPYGDVILPRSESTVDYEAELAFVIGRGGRYIPAEQAFDHIAGFCAAQDISERRLQRAAGGQFCLGKSFDTFCPLGPALVTLDELDDPANLPIVCRVNGELRQEDSSKGLVIDVPHLVEVLSSVTTLRPGDVCLTGTPSGVGVARDPQVFLRPGDLIETEIGGIGRLRNRCVPEQATDPAR